MKFKIGKTYEVEANNHSVWISKLYKIDRKRKKLVFEDGHFLTFGEIKERKKWKLKEIKNADEIEL